MTDKDAALRQALEALEGVAQWVEKRPNTHPWDAWQRVEPAIAAIDAAIDAKVEQPEHIKAGDGTLQGAIDYWQAEVERLRAELEREAADHRQANEDAAQMMAERDALRQDAERLDWLQRAADARKVELAKSLYGTGYEIGEWPSMRVTVKNGALRDAIDAARKDTP